MASKQIYLQYVYRGISMLSKNFAVSTVDTVAEKLATIFQSVAVFYYGFTLK